MWPANGVSKAASSAKPRQRNAMSGAAKRRAPAAARVVDQGDAEHRRTVARSGSNPIGELRHADLKRGFERALAVQRRRSSVQRYNDRIAANSLDRLSDGIRQRSDQI